MSMDPELQRAQAARVPYVTPVTLGDPWGRGLRMPPHTSVHASYAGQVHWRRVDDRRVALRAVPGDLPPYDDLTGRRLRWFVTAWNPVGRASTLRENEEAQERLRHRVAELGGQVAEVAVTTAADRSWVEESLVVEGLTVDRARSLGHEFGQPAVTAWTVDCLTVVPTLLIDAVGEHRSRWEEVAVDLSCPMRSDDAPGERCFMHGGPYGSAAIHAARLWKVHRTLLLRLGCAPCDDGRGPTLGPWGGTVGGVALSAEVLASRWGGYAWR